MRVLLLTLDFLPNTGGVARYLDDLAHYFGEEITVVAPESSVEVDRPYRIERTKILGDVVWPKWLRAVWVLLGMRREYDHILISHVLPLGTAARVAFWFTGKPYSIFVHGLDLSFAKRTRVKRWITTRVLLEAANIFANSRALADEVKNDFRVERVHTVYPVVSERPVYEEEPIGEEDSVIRLLTVARLVARKGHVRVLRAMKALRERGMTLHYHIVGDGPMREEIEELALELQLDHAVTIEHSA